MVPVLSLLAISVMIIVHEAGHYFVARWSGMRVERFSLGFGPPILKWRSAGTQFQVTPILFGGFVHIVGMNPHEQYDEKDPSVYPNRPTILRFLTILAGPMTNMLLAVILAFAMFSIGGLPTATGRTLVSGVSATEASAGKLEPGDIVVAMNGQPVTVTAFKDQVQKSQGAPVALTVVRHGAEVQVEVTPKKDEKSGGWLLGVIIQAEGVRKDLGLARAAYESLRYPVIRSQEILGSLWDVATGKVPPDAVGPVGMVKMIGSQIRSGWLTAFDFLAMLNVYLCLFNLLPIPALDGARLVFLGYELATRRRPNPKVETTVHLAGAVVLIIVMLLVTFKDIRNLFS